MPTGGIRSRALWRGRIRVSTPCMPRFHVLSSQSRIPFQPSSTLLGRLPHSSHCCYPRPPTPTTGPKTQEIHSWLHSRLAPPTPSFKSPLSKVPRSKFFSFCEISARGTPDRALTTSQYLSCCLVRGICGRPRVDLVDTVCAVALIDRGFNDVPHPHRRISFHSQFLVLGSGLQ